MHDSQFESSSTPSSISTDSLIQEELNDYLTPRRFGCGRLQVNDKRCRRNGSYYIATQTQVTTSSRHKQVTEPESSMTDLEFNDYAESLNENTSKNRIKKLLRLIRKVKPNDEKVIDVTKRNTNTEKPFILQADRLKKKERRLTRSFSNAHETKAKRRKMMKNEPKSFLTSLLPRRGNKQRRALRKYDSCILTDDVISPTGKLIANRIDLMADISIDSIKDSDCVFTSKCDSMSTTSFAFRRNSLHCGILNSDQRASNVLPPRGGKSSTGVKKTYIILGLTKMYCL